MLLKELKNQILNNHNFDNFIYNGKLINKSFIHKAKKDDLEEILKLLIEDKEKKEIINKITLINYNKITIRYFNKNKKSFQFIFLNPSYDLSNFNCEILEIIFKQLNHKQSELKKIKNKLINLELDISYKYPILNLNGGSINCDNKWLNYNSVYDINDINKDITEYSNEELNILIKKIKNRIYLFDMIYNELNKEREYKSLCNVVDKNYGNYNLEKKELEIFKDALMKVGYGNMRYKYSFNNLENIISYLN